MARDLEAALRRRGIDACAPVHRDIQVARAGIWRSLAPQASVVVAIWTQADSVDKLFLEMLEQAAVAKRLIAASADGAPPPTPPTPVACTVEALSQAAERHVAATQNPIVRREYGALRKACASGRAEAWRAFLRAHPDGVFQAVAHAQLDMSSAPGYRPNPAQFTDAVSPWRTQPKRATLGLTALAGALGAVALAVYFGQHTANNAPAMPAPHAAPFPALQPPQQSAAPAQATQDEPSVADELARLAAPPEPAPPMEAIERPTPQIASVEPVAVAITAPTASAALVATVSTPLARPVNSAQIEPGLRAVVEQARRRQNYARDRAARSANARTLAGAERAGRYLGDWADGGPSGLGAANWTDGARYEGSWRRARPDGLGVLSLANGIRYEGEFNDGSPTGRGVFWGGDGRQITGEALFGALVAARSAGPAP